MKTSTTPFVSERRFNTILRAEADDDEYDPWADASSGDEMAVRARRVLRAV